MARRVGKVLFIVLLVFGLLVAALVGFVTSAQGSRWISGKLDESLERQTGLSVAFSNIDIRIFPPRLIVRDLVVNDSARHLDCTISESEISPDPVDLLSGVLSVEEIYLGSPSCNATLDTAVLEQLKRSSRVSDSEATELDLSFLPSFDVVALSEGNFTVTLKDPNGLGSGTLKVNGLSLDITGENGNIEIRGLIRHAAATYDRQKIHIAESLKDFEWRAALTGSSLDVRQISADIAGIQLRGRDIHVPLPLRDRELKAAYLSVDVPLALANRLPLALPNLKGSAGFSGQVSFKTAEGRPTVTARGKVRLKDGHIDNFVIGDLDGAVALSSKGLTFSQLEIHNAGGVIKADGDLAFDEDLTLSADLNLADIELGQLLENVTLADPWVLLKISGDIGVNGTLKKFSLKGQTRLSVRDHRVFDRSFHKSSRQTILAIDAATVAGRFSVNGKAFEARGLQVRSGESAVAVDMKFGFGSKDGWRLNARSTRMALEDIGKIVGLKVAGHGSLDVSINAPMYRTPRINGTAAFQRFSFAGYDFNRIRSEVVFDGRRLNFRNVAVESPKSQYSSREIAIDLGARRLTVEAKVDIERAAVEELAKSFHVDTRGYGSPSGYVAGRVAVTYGGSANQLRVETTLDHEGLTIFNEVFGPESIDLVYDDGNLTVNRFGLAKGRGSILVTGAVSKQRDINFMAVASDIAIEDFVYPGVSDLELEGTAQIFSVLEGTLDHPVGQVSVRLADVTRRGVRYGSSDFDLDVDGTRIVGHGELAERRIIVEHGVADFDADRFEVEAFVHDLDITSFVQNQSSATPLAVKVTGETSISGRLNNLSDIQGIINLSDVSIDYKRFHLVNRTPLFIAVKNDSFQLSPTRFTGDHVVVGVEGRADPRRIRFAVEGLANLRAITLFTDAVTRSDGKLAFNAVISGSLDEPKIRGDARVENGSLAAKGLPEPVTDINGRIEFGGKNILFKEFSARSAGGAIDMDGQIALKGTEISDYRFRGFLTDVGLTVMDGVTLRLSTVKEGLLLTPGRKRRLPTITGDVEVSNFHYTRDTRIIEMSDLSMDNLSGRKIRVHTPKVFDKSKDMFVYDIRLHGDRNLSLRNNIIDARLQIDDREDPLRIVGSNQTYGFLGRVIASRGQVRFAGKTFDIRNAQVVFKDLLRPDNPSFRVTADVEIRDWRVTIIAEGTVEEYEVRLSAQPYLSHEDVVLLLLTGMTRSEHAQNNSQGFTGSLAPIIGNVSGGIIPVEVNIYSEYSEKVGEDTTRVALGRRITENIWVQLSASLGEDRDIEGNVDYKINDNFSLSASYDNASDTSRVGNWGLDLKFRMEF